MKFVSPKLTTSLPKVTDEFANEPFAILVNVLSRPLIVLFVKVSDDVSVTIEPSVEIVILLFSIDVLTPEPPTISKLSPKLTLKLVDVSSPIVILLLISLSFEIELSPIERL